MCVRGDSLTLVENMTTGVVPSTLLRAAKKLAVQDGDADVESAGPELSIGVLLGTTEQVDVEDKKDTRVAIWGLVRAEADLYVQASEPQAHALSVCVCAASSARRSCGLCLYAFIVVATWCSIYQVGSPWWGISWRCNESMTMGRSVGPMHLLPLLLCAASCMHTTRIDASDFPIIQNVAEAAAQVVKQRSKAHNTTPSDAFVLVYVRSTDTARLFQVADAGVLVRVPPVS